MKRYVFTIVFALAGIVGISFFYGYANETAATLENFRIETVSGDEKELEYVSLAGRLHKQNVTYSLLVSQNQAELNTNSVLNWTSTVYIESGSEMRIKELQQKYRSFMRGKESPYQLYEDGHFLVYAELDGRKAVDDTYLGDIHLSFLDKGKEDGKDFVLSLPKELEKYRYLTIDDVQLLDQEVVLMLEGSQGGVNALWRVAININQEKVVSQTLIHEMKSDGSAYMYAGNDSMLKEKYMPIREMHDEERPDGTILTMEKQFVVNVENGELLEISMPDKYQFDEYGLVIDDESIYHLAYEEGMMYQYNFTKKAFEPIWSHDALTSGNVLLAVKDKRAYLLENGTDRNEGRTEGDIHFYVMDTDNGEELYHGRIEGATDNTEFNFTTIYPKQFE